MKIQKTPAWRTSYTVPELFVLWAYQPSFLSSLGMSRGTLYNRLRELEDNGIMTLNADKHG